MSHLPVVDPKAMEKILLALDFRCASKIKLAKILQYLRLNRNFQGCIEVTIISFSSS